MITTLKWLAIVLMAVSVAVGALQQRKRSQ
jgi:hypothetical protein